MTNQSDTLTHLGPYVSQPYLADLCDFVERVWETYREHATDYGSISHGSLGYLIVRMMYIAEVTSNGIRFNATWGLTPAAMSLLRDRYEQAVRFSWLVRNPDDEEFLKYERAIFGKMNALVRNADPATVSRFEDTMGPISFLGHGAFDQGAASILRRLDCFRSKVDGPEARCFPTYYRYALGKAGPCKLVQLGLRTI